MAFELASVWLSVSHQRSRNTPYSPKQYQSNGLILTASGPRQSSKVWQTQARSHVATKCNCKGPSPETWCQGCVPDHLGGIPSSEWTKAEPDRPAERTLYQPHQLISESQASGWLPSDKRNRTRATSLLILEGRQGTHLQTSVGCEGPWQATGCFSDTHLDVRLFGRPAPNEGVPRPRGPCSAWAEITGFVLALASSSETSLTEWCDSVWMTYSCTRLPTTWSMDPIEKEPMLHKCYSNSIKAGGGTRYCSRKTCLRMAQNGLWIS